MSGHGLSEEQVQVLLQQLDTQEQAVYRASNAQEKEVILRRLIAQNEQAQQQQQWYRIFKPESDSVAYDPLDPVKRYHDGIFVLTDKLHGHGKLHHVTGDIIADSGMRYEEKEGWTPGQSADLHKLTPIGAILKTDLDSGILSSILRALPRPTKQQGVDFWNPSPAPGQQQIIWTREDGEPYGPGETRRPIMKCNEWTSIAIATLRSQGVLRQEA